MTCDGERRVSVECEVMGDDGSDSHGPTNTLRSWEADTPKNTPIAQTLH